MSNIEKIRQEIERRIENYWSDGDVDSVVVSGELEELIDFIDSLPEEHFRDSTKMISEELDLDKEYNVFVESDPVYSKLVNNIVGKAIARHFAEWGAEHLKR